MTIVDTYDNLTFTLLIVFLFICLFSIIVLIMFNIKARKKENPHYYDRKKKEQKHIEKNNSLPTLKCIPSQTLVGNVVQMTC
jgi:hypothetical protein